MHDSTPPTPASIERPCSCQNLNDIEVRKRKTLGYASFLAAFVAVGYHKVAPGGGAWVGWLPALPFFVGFLGLFQAQTRTCVALAFADKDMSGRELAPVRDRETGWRLKKRSVKLVVGAGAMALLAAAVCQKL